MWKIKNIYEADDEYLFSTGALTKEQYDFSLSGMVVKMGLDFDILQEGK